MSNMKGKIVKIFLAAFFLALLFFVVNAFVLNPIKYDGAKLDKESKAYVDIQIPFILQSWNGQKLVDQADPQLLKVTSKKDLLELFSAFSTYYGPMKSYDGSVGQAGIF